MSIIRNDDCKRYLEDAQSAYVLETTVCADNRDERLNAGDHGTALISTRSNQLIGLASVLLLNDGIDLNVYLRVEPYLFWIEIHMWLHG